MRILLVIILLAVAAPATAHAQSATDQPLRRVSIKQLLNAIGFGPVTNDYEMGFLLASMEPAERIDANERTNIRRLMPGDMSRDAFTAFADASLFLDPPAGSSTSIPAPSVEEQRRIMALVVDYVSNATHRFPNFFALRTTTRLEDVPAGVATGFAVTARRFPSRVVTTSKSTITYRDGKEVADPVTAKRRKHEPQEHGLDSWGLFGPILSTVLADAGRNKLEWRRWEETPSGRLAVFHYAVPMDSSNYEVKYCCIPMPGGVDQPLIRRSAYHGEIGVDPASGNIVRLTVQADLDQGDLVTLMAEATEGYPLQRADLWVEYGPVEIAGKTYNLPLHCVALSRARMLLRQDGGQSKIHVLGPVMTYTNEIDFTKYHVFRSESRILIDTQ